MDGVLSGVLGDGYSAEDLYGVIRDSKHYGQVRIIIFNSEQISCDHSELQSLTGKPFIVVSRETEFDPLYSFPYEEHTITPIGLDEASALRVLEVVSRDGRVPVLEYTEIILSGISEMHNV